MRVGYVIPPTQLIWHTRHTDIHIYLTRNLDWTPQCGASFTRPITSRNREFGDAKKNITSAQTKQKESYDLKHQPVFFSVGSQVLLENTAQKNRKGGKLEPAWLGPYTVNKYVGKGLYELSRKGSVLKKKAIIVRLKL